MTQPPTPTPPIAVPVVPPHRGSGPLTAAQIRIAYTRIATEMLTQVAQDLEGCPASVRQRACEVLSAVVELQAALTAQP